MNIKKKLFYSLFLLFATELYSDAFNKVIYASWDKPDVELLYVYSRIGEIFNDTNVDEDLEDGLLTIEELRVMIDIQLTSFLNFIKFTDDLITKNVDIKDILQVSKETLNGRNFKK